jgi:ferredoxin
LLKAFFQPGRPKEAAGAGNKHKGEFYLTKFRIDFDRTNCIGAGACVAVLPDAYSMQGDGKPDLAGSDTSNKDVQTVVLDLTPQELEKHILAARSCPVLVIHVTNLETNEKII